MPFPYRYVSLRLEEAARELFQSDSRVQAVGITSYGDGFGFRVVRNKNLAIPLSMSVRALDSFEGIPVSYADAFAEPKALIKLPASGPGSPGISSFIPEQLKQRHLTCGLQIQNIDDDDRKGHLRAGHITVGTLGCFVNLADGTSGILSCNHVLAGENTANTGDRVIQPGCGYLGTTDDIAELHDFSRLQFSPSGATPQAGTAVYNQIDAAVAKLNGLAFVQGFLSFRGLPLLNGLAQPNKGDQVFKVGRTTGYTLGEITMISTIVGPVDYDRGRCWFNRSIEIEGLNGTLFSDRGDSGAAVLKISGEVLGILYAGNGTQNWACPIDLVCSDFNCSLV